MYDYEQFYYPDYLMHYGVKGMKWGHRKRRDYQSQEVLDKRAAYKQANKAYKKSFNKASNYSSLHPIRQFVSEKKRAESDRRWDDAINKADAANKAKDAYKQAKKANKAAVKETYNKIQKNSSIGQKLMYNDATRKRAAQYVVNNKMSVDDAMKRAKSDANRNTAVFVAAYGAVALGTLYAQSRR